MENDHKDKQDPISEEELIELVLEAQKKRLKNQDNKDYPVSNLQKETAICPCGCLGYGFDVNG